MVTKDNFNAWFRDVLRALYKNKESGFVVLITSLTLLERLLREKSGIKPEKSLDDRFYSEFIKWFPKVPDVATARIFWKMCRHGLMHQATFGTRAGGVSIVEIGINEDVDVIEAKHTEGGYSFMVSPTKFSERVLAEIDRDFASFEAPGSPEYPLPQTESGSATECSGYSGFKR